MSDAIDPVGRRGDDVRRGPDHGLRDPETRAAWRELLLGLLPPAPARIADLGCGTGTLTTLLAAEGYTVDGVDFSPEMVQLARAKAGDDPGVTFVEADASAPPLEPASYDVVLSRHVLWAMPSPADALRRWGDLLHRAVGCCSSRARGTPEPGSPHARPRSWSRRSGAPTTTRHLDEAVFWGREIDDERYVVVSPPAP